MRILPSAEAFSTLYQSGAAQLVRTVLVADCETPVAAYMKLAQAFSGPSFLLESVEGGAVRGRYSMIGLSPDIIWRCTEGRVSTATAPALTDFRDDPRDAFASLRALLADSALPDETRDGLACELPPMAAGVFGYLGYDMVRLMERLAPRKATGLGLPDAVLIRPTIMVVFDAVRDEITVITPVRPVIGTLAKAAYERAQERIDAAVLALEQPLRQDASIDLAAIPEPVVTSNTTPVRFAEMVAAAKEYILAGDIFQVVLSQRFDAPFSLPPFALYRALRRVNPAPFLCYLDFVDYQIVCSSPEILVRLRSGKVTIRPIAGTRPRGVTPGDDERLAAELLADPKERAEHLMLLDLGRNDVGRVARIGSVRVTDSFFVERYSQVMHIVSNVEGDHDVRHDAIDVLAAGFPAGTVSGAPKVRAMEIIDEMEADARGAYAGCIGYFGANGDMDTCIVLRTAVVKDGVMSVQAGAGIVHDSDPASEQQECINKAKALFRAAEEAVRFASLARRGQ
jgi:anthranilate synthase component I